MGWIGCVRCEKFWCDFVARTFALIAPVQPVLYRASCSTKQSKIHPNMSLGPTGWIGCIPCEKFWCDFVARTSTLIAPVQPVLHRVSCCNKILQNAPKHYELHQNMSLGFNGVDGVSYCEKFWCNFVERTFALIAPVQPVFMELRAVTKLSKMHPNTTRRTKTWV